MVKIELGQPITSLRRQSPVADLESVGFGAAEASTLKALIWFRLMNPLGLYVDVARMVDGVRPADMLIRF